MSKKNGFSYNNRILLFSSIFALIGIGTLTYSFAAPQNGKGGGKNPDPNATVAVKMVTDRNGDGQPNWNDVITYEVSSIVHSKWVNTECRQNNVVVYRSIVGFFEEYPWSTDVQLYSDAWSGGAADCTANLYTVSGKRQTPVTLALISFKVNQ